MNSLLSPTPTNQQIQFEPEVIKRYDKAGPRYTSYPTAVQFHAGFTHQQYREQCRNSSQDGPLSLYFHLPFCDTICYYCACNKVVTKDRSKALPYLVHLHREIEMQAALLPPGRVVNQLHWGGGTPTFLSDSQMTELMEKTAQHFTLRNDDLGEYSIEVDPRKATAQTMRLLRKLGFNRLSLGVQDFDQRVQQAVNRLQSVEETFEVLHAARECGFHGVSVDLIYGLPLQTVQSFRTTLDTVLQASPDRLSIFNYAHLPERFKPQLRIHPEQLPSPASKLEILQSSIEHLTQAGYVFIGMDHFAKPDDPLAVAQREGRLHRNFQGYATHADCDLIAMGISAIGQVGDCFTQNVKTLDAYAQAIEQNALPLERGFLMNQDDKLRRAVIMQLICHFQLDIQAIERQFNIVFASYFAQALESLPAMQADGLLRFDQHHIQVSAAGRLLIRNICMLFDNYLPNLPEKKYSRAI